MWLAESLGTSFQSTYPHIQLSHPPNTHGHTHVHTLTHPHTNLCAHTQARSLGRRTTAHVLHHEDASRRGWGNLCWEGGCPLPEGTQQQIGAHTALYQQLHLICGFFKGIFGAPDLSLISPPSVLSQMILFDSEKPGKIQFGGQAVKSVLRVDGQGHQ